MEKQDKTTINANRSVLERKQQDSWISEQTIL